MEELILVKSLLVKSLYDLYRYKLELDYYKDNNNILYKIIISIDYLYNNYKDVEKFSEADVLIAFNTNYPGSKDLDSVSTILDRVSTQEINPDICRSAIIGLIKHQILSKIANKAILLVQKRSDGSELETLYDQWKATEEDVQEEENEDGFISTSVIEIYSEEARKEGLRWRLKTLNKILGSLRKGNFGFLFARPETGKTTFLASEVSHMAMQAKERELGPVLWFNNEEDGKVVMARFHQATLGATAKQIYDNKQRAEEKFNDLVGDYLKFYDSAAISRKIVEKLCEKYQPSLVVFDQLDKIKGFEEDRQDIELGVIYQWAREIAKKYAPVIAVCQASASGENKKYLTMNDVADAKTAKQAEADWILGIGMSHQDGMEFIRHLNISKNKLQGDPDSVPEMRHGHKDVLIKPEIARYEDFKWDD